MQDRRWVQRCHAMRDTWEKEHDRTKSLEDYSKVKECYEDVEETGTTSQDYVVYVTWANYARDLRDKLQYRRRNHSGYCHRPDLYRRDSRYGHRFANSEPENRFKSRRYVRRESRFENSLRTAHTKVWRRQNPMPNHAINNPAEQHSNSVARNTNSLRTAHNSAQRGQNTMPNHAVSNPAEQRSNSVVRNTNSLRTANNSTQRNPPNIGMKNPAEKRNSVTEAENSRRTAHNTEQYRQSSTRHITYDIKTKRHENNNVKNRNRTEAACDNASYSLRQANETVSEAHAKLQEANRKLYAEMRVSENRPHALQQLKRSHSIEYKNYQDACASRNQMRASSNASVHSRLGPTNTRANSPRTASNSESENSQHSSHSNFWGEGRRGAKSYDSNEKKPRTASNSENKSRQHSSHHSSRGEARHSAKSYDGNKSSARTASTSEQPRDSHYSRKHSNYGGEASHSKRSKNSHRTASNNQHSKTKPNWTARERERQRQDTSDEEDSPRSENRRQWKDREQERHRQEIETSAEEEDYENRLGTAHHKNNMAELAEVQMQNDENDRTAKADLSTVVDGEKVDWLNPDMRVKDHFIMHGICRTKLLLQVLHSSPSCFHDRNDKQWYSRNAMTPSGLRRVMLRLNLSNASTVQYKRVFKHLKTFSGTHLFIKHALDHGGFPESLQNLEDEARNLRQHMLRGNSEITTCPDWHQDY